MNSENDSDFESGIQGASSPTERPTKEDRVKKGLHVLNHFKAEKGLSGPALDVAIKFHELAENVTDLMTPGNVLTSCLERLLDARQMAVQHLRAKR
jgi:hypothetical protein